MAGPHASAASPAAPGVVDGDFPVIPARRDGSVPTHVAVLAAEPIKDCDLGFVPLKPIEGVGSIIGTAWAQCDVKPEAHVMTLSLDRRQGNDWVAAITAPPDPQIPPGSPQRASYQVKTLCQAGLWRVTAEAHGYGPTGVPFSFTDHSLTAFIQCSRGM